MVFNAILQKYVSYILAVSFIDEGSRSTLRKPPTCRKKLTNMITLCSIEHTSPKTKNVGGNIY